MDFDNSVWRVLRRLAIPAVVVGMLSVAAPASAAPEPPDPSSEPQVVLWRDGAGARHGARALTAAEIKAKGLDKYIDMSRQKETAPQIAGVTGAPATEVTAQKRSPGGSSVHASGCWTHWFGEGRFSFPEMWGRTDVNWCGDGQWITYSTSNCYGYDNYPTYNFEGCNNYPNYGAGWNVYNVETHFYFCVVYVPVWGTCASRDHAWDFYQYFGSGAVNFIDGDHAP